MDEMFTASRRLKALRERTGLSVREVARRLGKPASTYATYEDRYKKPFLPHELVAELLPVFSEFVPKQEIYALSGAVAGVPGEAKQLAKDAAEFYARKTLGISEPAPAPQTTVMPGELMVGDKDLPVYASAEGGPEGAMIISYDPIEWVKRPEPLMTVKNGFAIYVVNDSMVPAFRPGDRALVHPLRQPVAGDDGLFIGEMRDGSFHALVKTLVASTERAWRVQQYNPASTFDLPKETWSKAMKIVGKYGR
ncbi:MAG: helix-turn-helix domain-containing protein [Brevundimonas sp.]